MKEVLKIRSLHPRMGGRKLYEKLEPVMLEHQIKMGRDALFSLLASNNLLVRRRKRRICTTNSFHWLRKYPNLIMDVVPSRSNELWVSDITYWKTAGGLFYISLITDAYSHKIVGYHLAKTLESVESAIALKMALKSITKPSSGLIHHSDRGIQYCSHEYVKLLQDYGIMISMTENGDPRENAIAERVNGIIKTEYLECHPVKSYSGAKNLLENTVRLYNQDRPHLSISKKCPAEVHKKNQKTEKHWKTYCKTKPSIVNQLQD